MRGGLHVIAALAAVFLLAAAATAPGLTRGLRAEGARALDGGIVTLADGEARLSGVRVPAGDDPFAAEARALLEQLTAGRPLLLRQDTDRRDRRGRLLAQIFVTGPHAEELRPLTGAGASRSTDDPLWVQGALLSAGLARVQTTQRTAGLAAEMLALEQTARAEGRGVWARPEYAVHTPDPGPLLDLLDTFQIVEGVVVSAAETRRFAYLNFDADYRADFTISIPRARLRAVRGAGVEPLELEGRRVRVRGYLHAVNGPMIDLDHAAQIEILD